VAHVKFFDFRTHRTITVVQTDGQGTEYTPGMAASPNGFTILNTMHHPQTTIND
jgi:hypothetical protein